MIPFFPIFDKFSDGEEYLPFPLVMIGVTTCEILDQGAMTCQL